MTMKMRYLYRDRGDHISMRSAHEYIIDPRDIREDGSNCFGREFVKIEKDPEEVEFDHRATDEELAAAFPKHKKPAE